MKGEKFENHDGFLILQFLSEPERTVFYRVLFHYFDSFLLEYENRFEREYGYLRPVIQEVVSILKAERSPVVLRPETMGKKRQFGSLEEVLLLCRELDGVQPCVDFSHIHARGGKANIYREFYRILKKIGKKLGDGALKNMHIHISGSRYNDKGEMKHLNLEESDFLFDEWIQVLKDFDVRGMLICESPEQDKDALMLKNLFYS